MEGGLLTDPILEYRRSCERGAYPGVDACPAVEACGPGACYQCGSDDVYDAVMKDMQSRAETDAMKRTAPEIFEELQRTKEELRVAKAQLEGYNGMLTRAEVLELTKPLRFRKDPPTGVRVEKLTERERGYLHGLLKASGVF